MKKISVVITMMLILLSLFGYEIYSLFEEKKSLNKEISQLKLELNNEKIKTVEAVAKLAEATVNKEPTVKKEKDFKIEDITPQDLAISVNDLTEISDSTEVKKGDCISYFNKDSKEEEWNKNPLPFFYGRIEEVGEFKYQMRVSAKGNGIDTRELSDTVTKPEFYRLFSSLQPKDKKAIISKNNYWLSSCPKPLSIIEIGEKIDFSQMAKFQKDDCVGDGTTIFYKVLLAPEKENKYLFQIMDSKDTEVKDAILIDLYYKKMTCPDNH